MCIFGRRIFWLEQKNFFLRVWWSKFDFFENKSHPYWMGNGLHSATRGFFLKLTFREKNFNSMFIRVRRNFTRARFFNFRLFRCQNRLFLESHPYWMGFVLCFHDFSYGTITYGLKIDKLVVYFDKKYVIT